MQSIEFSGGGEPLTHPSIEKLISICSNRLNLSVGVITNGVLLTPSISHLIVSRAVYIRISIYPETFDIVKEKIRYLGTLKKRYSSGITLGTKLLLSRRNVNIVVEQCRQLAQMDEIDLISVKAERNSGDEVDNQTARQVSQTLNDIGDGRMSVALHKTYLTQKCWLTPIHTVIDPLGDVYMCCYYPHRKHQHRIGNIYEQNYDQFWWSEVHVEKIRRISITQCNLYDCRWHEYNNVLDRLLEDNELHYQFC